MRVDVDVENHTGRVLAIEHRWEDMGTAVMLDVPEGARPRIVLVITDMTPEDDDQ